MTEFTPPNNTPEKDPSHVEESIINENMSAEEALEYYLSFHPEARETSQEQRDCRPEITELQGLMDKFKNEHPIEELFAITDLSVEEAPHHPIREPARLALIPIVELLNRLKKETDISPEEYERLKAEYRHLSQAVGMINKGLVDHTR